jgi:hypothetical protein
MGDVKKFITARCRANHSGVAKSGQDSMATTDSDIAVNRSLAFDALDIMHSFR